MISIKEQLQNYIDDQAEAGIWTLMFCTVSGISYRVKDFKDEIQLYWSIKGNNKMLVIEQLNKLRDFMKNLGLELDSKNDHCGEDECYGWCIYKRMQVDLDKGSEE